MSSSVMAAQAMSFQAPTSLAGTLAAYEARRKSSLNAHGRKDATSSVHQEHATPPSVEAIYQRNLPSLHFLRWRPMYHLQAPSGWMNDPCAPGYDPVTGLYHLFFQWNPRRNVYGAVAWGSICWGHAVSSDMVHWTVGGKTALKPGPWYDKEGCFTGCLVATGLDGTPGLTLFYTGVSRLPLHHSLPYKRQTETLAVAQNQGPDWVKMKGNPLLPEPPEGLDVSGWRDPYIARWAGVDRLLGREEGQTLYGAVSGGIKGTTPTMFLYAINPDDLTQWVFLSTLVDLGLNHHLSRWSGDMGINWECGNFMTLTSDVDGSQRDFIIVGGEGSQLRPADSAFTEYPQPATKFPRNERSLQWMSGELYGATGAGGHVAPKVKYVAGGQFDHGLMYGVNTFRDPVGGKQIAYGWITEEDLPQRLVDRQNWSGMISIPRELSLICIPNVVGTLKTELSAISSIELEPSPDGSHTVRTLGRSPASSLAVLRKGARSVEMRPETALGPDPNGRLDVQTCRFELAALFTVSDRCARIGMTVHHSPDLDPAVATTISLDTDRETCTIDRPDASPVDDDIHTYPEKAPFTLFTTRRRDGQLEREKLEIRAFFDESVLEVFVNSRCTFATRIYPASKRCWGVRFWAHDDSRRSTLVTAQAWDGLRADIQVA